MLLPATCKGSRDGRQVHLRGWLMTGAADARSTVVMMPPAENGTEQVHGGHLSARCVRMQQHVCTPQRQGELRSCDPASRPFAHLRLGYQLPKALHTCRRTAHLAPPQQLQ